MAATLRCGFARVYSLAHCRLQSSLPGGQSSGRRSPGIETDLLAALVSGEARYRQNDGPKRVPVCVALDSRELTAHQLQDRCFDDLPWTRVSEGIFGLRTLRRRRQLRPRRIHHAMPLKFRNEYPLRRLREAQAARPVRHRPPRSVAARRSTALDAIAEALLFKAERSHRIRH